MRYTNFRLFPLLATLELGGCFTLPPPTTIQASDDGVFQPVGRLTVNLSRLQGAPSEPQSGHAIELGVTKASGGGSQTLSSGQQPVVFGSRTFSPPQQLKYDFDFTYADVSYRWRRFFRDGAFGIEALGGVGYADLDFTVRSATQRASEDLSSLGLALGVGALWRLRPGTSLQGRVTAFGGGDVSSASRIELFLVQALGRNAALRAGYAAWKVESDRGDAVSKVEVNFSGPALGLDVMF